MAAVIVRFGADIAGLVGGIDNARSSITKFKTEMSSATDSGSTGLRSIIDDAAAVSSALGTAAFATAAFSKSFDFAEAAKNFKAGDFAAIGEQLRLAGRGMAVLAAQSALARGAIIAAGVGAAVGAVEMAVLARQALDTAAAVEGVAKAMAFSGNSSEIATSSMANGFATTSFAIGQYLTQLQQIPGVTETDAAQIEALFGSIHNYSTTINDALVQLLSKYAMNSDQAKTAAKEWAAVFDDPNAKGQNFLQTLGGVTAAEMAQFHSAQQSGNVNKMNASIYDVLVNRLKALAAESTRATREQITNAQAWQAGSAAGQTFVDNLTRSLAKQNAEIDKNISALRQQADLLRNRPESTEQTAFQSAKVVDQVNPVSRQMDSLAGKIETVNARLIELRTHADALNGGEIADSGLRKEYDQLSETLAKLEQQQTDLRNQAKGGTPVQLTDLANAQKSVQAGQDQLRDAQAILGATKAMAEQATDLQTKTQLTAQAAKQELQVRQQELDLAKARNALTRAKSNDSDGAAAVAEAKANEAAIEKVWAKGTQQRIEGETNVLTTTKQADAEKQATDAAAENASYELAKAASDRKIADIQYEVEMRQISTKQGTTAQAAEYANQRALATAHFEKLTAIYDNDSKQYRTASLEKLKVDAELAAKQLAVVREASQQTLQSYTQTFERVGSSVSSNLMQMIQGNEKFGAAVKSVATGIVESMLQSGVKMVADWAAKQAAAVALTVAGETAKTAAATTGEAARTGVAAAGAAAQETSAIASFIPMILADAKATIAGVTAFLAPILGPAAPAAGAAAGAGVAALASFDVGSWQIPSDMIARVHQGEMIVPAAHTPWAQSLLANGGAFGGTGGDVHHHFSPVINMPSNASGMTARTLRDHADTLVKILKAEHKRGAFAGTRA